MTRKVTDIVGDHQRGQARVAPGREIGRGVAKEADGGADERVVVEDVAANGGVLGRAQGPDPALFGGGGDGADGAAAHAAGAEFEVAIKAVIELAPSLLGHELVEACGRPSREVSAEPSLQVFKCGGKEVPGCARGLKRGE